MTNEQRNKIIDERLLQNNAKLLQMEMDLIQLKLANDTEMIEAIEKSIEIIKQSNVEIEKMKVM